MHGTGLQDTLRSAANGALWALRSRLRWHREGYRESGAEGISLGAEEQALEIRSHLSTIKPYLSADVYRKNLWTFALLEEFLAPILPEKERSLKILEPGCQDFSRIPALHSFFRCRGFSPQITGLELDPFPVLHDFHSRWDKAKYYLKHVAPDSRYEAADFFLWNQPADLICCFYPFVSPHPALAWGLPARFGDPVPWVRSFERNLKPGALLLVVHQGEWEVECFDRARNGSELDLLRRGEFSAHFYPLPHPACVSVYRRDAKGQS